MRNIGIDLGSRYIKVYDDDGNYQLFDTVEFYKKYILRDNGNVSLDLSFLDKTAKETKIITTGYGRNLLQFNNTHTVSEIKAHFYGAKKQTNEQNFILVDLGGQDSKVIYVNNGFIEDFIMNDKCAASTGRFIENAAKLLNIPMEDFSKMVDTPVNLSDTCAVFCESELIGQIARGSCDTSLAAGVNLSIAKRLAPSIKKFPQNKVFASGGVANSVSIIHFLSEITGKSITKLPNPQFNGAIGCLEYATKILD